MTWRGLASAGVLGLGGGLGIAVAFGGACQTCDASVCESTLWVYFQEADGAPLSAGTYEWSVSLDGAAAAVATCQISDGGAEARCDGLDFILYAPLYGGPDQPHEVLELYFAGAPPAMVEVRLVHDGAVLFDDVIEPDYELADPGCDADCMEATERFTLPR